MTVGLDLGKKVKRQNQGRLTIKTKRPRNISVSTSIKILRGPSALLHHFVVGARAPNINTSSRQTDDPSIGCASDLGAFHISIVRAQSRNRPGPELERYY
jgi:hypothetical protein